MKSIRSTRLSPHNESSDLDSDDIQSSDLNHLGKEQAVYSTKELFGSKTKVKIIHQDSEYVLMITRNNRLVLNKI